MPTPAALMMLGGDGLLPARTHKRIARYRETSESAPAKVETISPVTSRPQILTTTTAEGRMSGDISSVSLQEQAGTPLEEWAIPVTRPRFKAEIRDI